MSPSLLCFDTIQGCLVSLLEWGNTRINLREIDALFELKKAKDDRLLGEHVDEEIATAMQVRPPLPSPISCSSRLPIGAHAPHPVSVQAEAVVASMKSAQRVGGVSQDVAEDLESLVVQVMMPPCFPIG